jgi:hypothetical protein
LSSQASNTLLATFNFPDVLFTQSFIQDKIEDFTYFKGGVRMTFRMVSNKFTYGKIMAVYHPRWDDFSVNNPFSDVRQLSGLPHVLISASAGEAVSFDFPFINPNRALKTIDYVAGEMGAIRLYVLNALTDINLATASAKIFTTAQFLEPKLFLPFTIESKVFLESKRGNSEAIRKTEEGCISSALDAMTDVASVLEVVPFVSQYANLFGRVSRPLTNTFKRLGLNKPASVAAVQPIKLNPTVDINGGSGLDSAPKLAMSPDNGISTIPDVGGISCDEMRLDYVTGTPQLIRRSPIDKTTAVPIMISSLDTDELCYCDHIARLFRYWSGSFKIKIYITASLFHSVRLVFWVNDGSAGSKWDCCYHQVVDVQGDTEVEMTLPYMKKQVANLHTTGADSPKLFVTMLSWAQPDMSLTKPIELNVYKAAASDFQWGELRDVQFTYQSNPRADFQKVFAPIHPSVQGYSHEGVLFGEKYTTVREIVHKYAMYFTQNNTVNMLNTYDAQGTLLNSFRRSWGIEMLGLFYSYWRGSIRMKLYTREPTRCQCVCFAHAGSNETISGISSLSTVIQPMSEVEVPYYYQDLYKSTRKNSADIIQWRSSEIERNFYLAKAAGDDFSFHFLTPPPINIGSFVPQTTSSTTGFNGFVTYYDALP